MARTGFNLLWVSTTIATAAAAALPSDADQAVPCRPTIACTADFVPPGTFEIEAGALYRRLPGGVGQWTSPLLLKLTVTRQLQLQVGTNGYTVVGGKDPAQYLDDLIVGPKVHLLDQGELWPALAFSAEVGIPTFERRGYLRTYDALFTAYVTKDLGPVHNDTNVGVNFWRLEEAPLTQVFAASAFSMNLQVRWLQIMLEGYVFSDAAPVAARDSGILFAFSETLRPWLVLDEGADIALVRSTRSYSLFLGFTIVPAVLWRPSKA
jgi:hypothetical protein